MVKIKLHWEQRTPHTQSNRTTHKSLDILLDALSTVRNANPLDRIERLKICIEVAPFPVLGVQRGNAHLKFISRLASLDHLPSTTCHFTDVRNFIISSAPRINPGSTILCWINLGHICIHCLLALCSNVVSAIPQCDNN